MTVAFFTIVAALTMLLIFLVIRLQNSQKVINNLKFQTKKTQRQVSHLNTGKSVLALTWQATLLNRLQASRKRALVSEQDGSVLELLFAGFSELLESCLNEGDTLEESITKYLSDKPDVDLQAVKDVIKKFPQDIRLAWSKNNAEGLILSFTKISERIDPLNVKQNKDKPASEQEQAKS